MVATLDDAAARHRIPKSLAFLNTEVPPTTIRIVFAHVGALVDLVSLVDDKFIELCERFEIDTCGYNGVT